jgi:hypothetical protein
MMLETYRLGESCATPVVDVMKRAVIRDGVHPSASPVAQEGGRYGIVHIDTGTGGTGNLDDLLVARERADIGVLDVHDHQPDGTIE